MVVIYFESANYASASQTYSPIIIDIDMFPFKIDFQVRCIKILYFFFLCMVELGSTLLHS